MPFHSLSRKMAGKENPEDVIKVDPPDNISKELPSSPESLVQAILANQSIISALSQAILSTMKQDLPSHGTAQSKDKGATAPVGQPGEKPTTVSVDQMV